MAAYPISSAQARELQAQELPGVLVPLARILGLFFLLTLWAVVMAIAYVYGGSAGLLGWMRLPEGLTPFLTLDLAMADVVAYAALFVAILLASTVQLNSTVSAAETIADRRPASAREALEQRRDLQSYANQAELAMIVSFGSAFAVLLLAVLFGLSEVAVDPEAAEVDGHGVGWAGLVQALPGLVHPRIMFIYFVSLLLFAMTFASLPEWKTTGLFQRQVEANAWEARARLDVIASAHDLDDVGEIRHPAGMRTAAAAGYLVYYCGFALVLNLALTLFAGDEGFQWAFSAGHLPMFLGFTLVALLLSAGVGSVMQRVFHLHGGSGAFSVVSIALLFIAVLFIVWAEGVGWTLGLASAMILYIALWVWLYRRAAGVLDEKKPTTWGFFLNPPKYTVVRRYEAIRRSAAVLTERGLESGSG